MLIPLNHILLELMVPLATHESLNTTGPLLVMILEIVTLEGLTKDHYKIHPMTYHSIHLIWKYPDYLWTIRGHGGLIIWNARTQKPMHHRNRCAITDAMMLSHMRYQK